MESSYEEAVKHLNGRKAPAKRSLDHMRGSDDMLKWLSLIGHSESELDCLNAIHVAGTNGKGSTCAFAFSFLKAHGARTGYPRKIGMYTSPHIRHIRERICINGEPISKECFATRFFEIWAKLPSQATPTLDIPRYLQLLALLAFHVFIEEKVDVAIIETHLGGEWDATNIIRSPTVIGITSIAEDHIHLLGPNIEDIAWHKSGIMKSGTPALSSIQTLEVASVLQQRALDKKVSLEFVDINHTLPRLVALVPETQRINCSLALELVRTWLLSKSPGASGPTMDAITDGVERFAWPGRYQRVDAGDIQWYLDGAHNVSSLRTAVQWFSKAVIDTSTLVLIFSHFSSRDTSVLLRTVAEALCNNHINVGFTIFTSYDESMDTVPRIDRNLTKRFSANDQKNNVDIWKDLCPTSRVFCERTIQCALDRARQIAVESLHKPQVLVTGSLHLVSGVIHLLDADKM